MDYIALGYVPTGFQRNFSCSAVLMIQIGVDSFSTTGLLPCIADLSRSLRVKNHFLTPNDLSYNPKKHAAWYGLFPFHSPLLRKSQVLSSLPLGTELFQFPRYASFNLLIQLICLLHHKSTL